MSCFSISSNTTSFAFDAASLEKLILSISDQFDFRVVLRDQRPRKVFLLTARYSLSGSLIGKHYMRNVYIVSAISGVCGISYIDVSMLDIWKDIKTELHDLFEIVYEYLAGRGFDDYDKAAEYLKQHNATSTELATIISEVIFKLLGRKVRSRSIPGLA